MEKDIRLKFKGSSKLQRVGNSLGITIPKEVVEILNLKRGDELLVCISKDNRAIVLFPPKNVAPKGESWEGASFELSIPKEIVEKLLKD